MNSFAIFLGARVPKQLSCRIKTESARKLSNFNFQGTKTLYQNNLKNIAFFFTFFKGLRYNKSSVVTPKKISHGSSEKMNVKFHKNCDYIGKILKISRVRCNSVKFDIHKSKPAKLLTYLRFSWMM